VSRSFRRDPGDGQLFAEGYLSDALRAWDEQLAHEVRGIDEARLLGTEPSAWIDHFRSRYEVGSLNLRTCEITASEPTEVGIDVSNDARYARRFDGQPTIATGTRVTFHLPFDGDARLFKYRPSSSFLSPMRASIGRGELLFTYHLLSSARTEEVQQEFDHERGLVEQVAGNVAREVRAHNAGLPDAITAMVVGRRDKLLADRERVGAFGYPVRRRDGAPTTYAVPTTRRRIAVPSPPARTGTAMPDPTLDMATYDSILDVCRNMAVVMERSPTAFRAIDEESIRTHFLMQLNGQFEGAATGETFNYHGKTDILIRVAGRNIFIAECKMWDGAASLTRAVDQVLGYASWRDTKTALFMFSRNKDFGAVLKQLGPTVRAHPRFREELPYGHDGGSRYLLARDEQGESTIALTVLAFDVPDA
jgi:hypothetical protein